MSKTFKIQYIPVEQLIKNEHNPRVVTEEGIAMLKESIGSEHGQDFFAVRPIIASSRTGENVIICGNTRYQAAIELGWDAVPAIIMDGLTEEQENELMVRDNVNNGEWDWEELGKHWDDTSLREWGLDMWKPAAPVDYSILDDEDEEGEDVEKVEFMAKNVLKAIQIEFQQEHYEEAYELIQWWRNEKMYIGKFLLDHLKQAKEKLESEQEKEHE